MIDISGQTTYPPVQLGFALHEEPNFSPPPGVAELRGKATVEVDLARAAHYFFTCIVHDKPSYHDVDKFLQWTLGAEGPHRFIGSAFSDDSEYNIDLSKTFSKLVGIGFMSGYAGSTWFANLSRKRWEGGVSSPKGVYSFSKVVPEDDGPDYLAAAFDPAAAGVIDPLFALEFKGHAARVDFDHAKFKKWRAQAENIACLGPDNEPRRMKSWVLAFNYAFAEGVGCREHSTLLVDDPIVGRNYRSIDPEGPAVEGIIRAHLARQCKMLGAGRLVPAVLLGVDASPQQVFPQVYAVRHPQLHNRVYVGWFCSLSPTGQLIWSGGPTRAGPLMNGDVELHIEGPGPLGFVHARVRSRGGSLARIDVFAASGWTPGEAERWVRSLFGGDTGGEVFVGQDATMLKGCIATAQGKGLAGEPFTSPVEFTTRASPRDGSYAAEVIRNGSLFVDSRLVSPVENSLAWWTEPGLMFSSSSRSP